MKRFDPFAPEVRTNPYPYYRLLQAEDPVHWCAADAWLVTRYADVQMLLRDRRLSHWNRGSQERIDAHTQNAFEFYIERWLMALDPYEQSDLRRQLVNLLGSNTLKRLAPFIEGKANKLIDAIPESGRIDIIADFAEPLVISVVCWLLGMHQQERARFQEILRDLEGNTLELINCLSSSIDNTSASRIFIDLLTTMIERRKAEPGQDLLSILVRASDNDAGIEAADIIPFTLLFIFASHENMVNFIGNSVFALLTNPHQWRRLAIDPGLISTAVNELVRFESPVQLMRLTAQEEFILAERAIRTGDEVLLALGAANRDSEQFLHPDRLDIGREEGVNLSFGSGPLRCIGARLALLECSIALSTLTRRVLSLRLLTASLTWRSQPSVLRGLTALPVVLEVLDA